MTSVFYFDLETSGLNYYHNEIIEFGISTHDCKDSLSILVKPNKPIDKKITELTGITNEILNDEGINIKEAVRAFHAFIRKNSKPTHKIWFIGHNVLGFDKLFYESILQRNKIEPYSSPIHWLDTLNLSKLLNPQMYSYRLITLCKYFRLKDTQTHRALGDCSLVALLFPTLIRQLFAKYPETKSNTSKHQLFNFINTILLV